jgi:hypothetical protein
MSIFPLRTVGAGGLVTDLNPHDLDFTQWSDARNVKFIRGGVHPASVFKNAAPDLEPSAAANDAFVGGVVFRIPGSETPLAITRAYDIRDMSASTDVFVTPTTDFTPAPSAVRVTSAFLGGITYVNRANWVPLSRTPAQSTFVNLPNWDEDDRAGALRSYRDFLIALDVTKGATAFPTMFKWSDAAQYGDAPPNWLTDDEASLAGENILNDATSPLVDGMILGDTFYAYTQTEVYAVNFIGAPLIFDWRKTPIRDGVMSVNCVASVNNRHYVFGRDDIYVHDGVTSQSLIEGRIKDYLYSIIDFNLIERCHVVHDPDTDEIAFHFPTTLDNAYASELGECTMAAVYNYGADTWSFIDSPYAVSTVRVTLNAAVDWNTTDETWAEAGSSWLALAGVSTKATAVISAGNLTTASRPRLLIQDVASAGRSTAPKITDFQTPAFVERTGLDMDLLGAQLRGRKLLRSIHPQVRLAGPDQGVMVRLGRATFSGSETVWQNPIFFNPAQDYKIDSRINDRYLAMRWEGIADEPFELTGYDLDLIQIAGR